MANTYYVNNTLYVGHAQGTAQAGGVNTITLAAGASSENDAYKDYGVWIVSGTGAGQSRRITAYDGTSKIATVYSNWAVNPNGTSVYEITVGSDENTGENEGVGATGSFRTWQKALDTVAAGDTVNIKAGRAYAEAADLKTAGTATLPILVRGYKTTPGDAAAMRAALPWLWPSDSAWEDYRAKLSGQSLTESIADASGFYCLEALDISKANAIAFGLPSLGQMTITNCRAHNSGTGINLLNGLIEYCAIDTNAWPGCMTGGHIVHCDVYNNAVYGISLSTSVSLAAFNRVWGNATMAINAGSGPHAVILNNTLIGNTKAAGEVGISLGTSSGAIVMNNLIHHFATGMSADADCGAMRVIRANLLSDVTTAYSNVTAGLGDILTNDPGFIDLNNGDYRLRYDSPARGAGWPLYLDMGAMQRREIATHRPVNLGVQI